MTIFINSRLASLTTVEYSRDHDTHADGWRNVNHDNEHLTSYQSRSSTSLKRMWEKYATQEPDENGHPYFQCLWKRDGEPASTCDYQAEKQAMKRHIEVTHLKIK